MTVDRPPVSGSEPQVASLVGQVLDGRYRILSKIGEGGMGEVFAAEHVHIEKRFAIKLLRPEIVSDPDAVTRFRQEARSSSSIGHRNIIAIEDFGQLADGRIYMCMELLAGAALNEMITQPMAIDRLLNIMIQTGHGLAAAHAKRIVHRDMKPENIFVTIGPNGEDIPKLLDFGIAKVSGNDGQNHLTRTGTIFGTPFYMAPEQALGNPVDARTDIYAVGVIMYECFAGSLPFQGESFMGILTQHITVEPEPVAQRAARAGRSLPPGLAEVIMRCLQKAPDQRFQTMDELVNVLIQIYRGIVGPGMSTYMEAFPVQPSAAHQVQATPVTAPYAISAQGTPVPSGRSGPAPIASAASSGVYPGAVAGPPVAAASKRGLGIAVIAVLVIGGGAAAVVLGGGGGKGGGKASGGSDLAMVPTGGDRGSARGPGSDGTAGGGSAAGHPAGHEESGSAAISQTGSGSDDGDSHSGPDPTRATGSGDATRPTGTGSVTGPGGSTGSGEGPEVDHPETGSNAPPPGEVVQVVLSGRNVLAFEVFENGVKLFDGPDSLAVPKGGQRTVMIRAPGFKDLTLAVQSVKTKTRFAMQPVRPSRPNPGPGPGPYSGSGREPPPQLNCSATILDPRSDACVRQYCKAHPEDEIKCHLE
jgi:serine/threonine-protein kinase